MRVVPLPEQCWYKENRKFVPTMVRRKSLWGARKSLWSSVSGPEKSGEIPIGKAFKGVLVLPPDGCSAWMWIQRGAEVSLPSEVPGRWRTWNCMASFFPSLFAHRDSKTTTSKVCSRAQVYVKEILENLWEKNQKHRSVFLKAAVSVPLSGFVSLFILNSG